MVTVVEGRKTRTLGLFPDLESAVAARARYIEYHAAITQTRTRETAIHPQNYEARPLHA